MKECRQIVLVTKITLKIYILGTYKGMLNSPFAATYYTVNDLHISFLYLFSHLLLFTYILYHLSS